MKTDKLASFRVDSELWKQFQAIARDNGTTASALLVGYIESVVNTGNVNTSTPQSIQPSIDNSPNQSIQDIDKRIDTKITESLEDGKIGEKIDNSYAAMMGNFNELLTRFEELEKKLIA